MSTSTHRVSRAIVLKSTVRAVSKEKGVEGIADGGANIGITSYDVARFYKRSIYSFDKPLEIHGVGDAVLESLHYADFGPVLGRFALLPGTHISTLISISNITDRGYVVEYSATGVIITLGKEAVAEGRFDADSRLWYLDIGELLLVSDRTTLDSPLHTIKAADWAECQTARANLGELKSVEDSEVMTTSSSAPRRKSRRGEIIPAWLVEAVFDLHNRVGHPSSKVMAMAIDHCMWIGVHPAITPTIVNKVFEKRHCIACEIGKMKHLVTPVGSGVKEIAVGDTISWDVSGKYSPATVTGAEFMFLFVCCATGYFIKFLTRNKSGNTAERCLREVITFFARHGHTVRRLKFDRGSVENSAQIDAVMAKHHIESLPAAFDTQRMNTIERYVQTFKQRMGTSQVCQNTLPATAWGHSATATELTMNCCPNELTHSYTPFELVIGKRPDVGRLFKYAFGCPLKCFDTDSTGFSHGQLAISLGYGAGNGAVYVIIPGRGLAAFERFDVAPLKISFPPMSEAQRRSFQPINHADGSIEMRSPVAAELDQNFPAYFDKRRSSLESHPSIATIDPTAIDGTSSSTPGPQSHPRSGSIAVLDDAQRILQRAWEAILSLITARGQDIEQLSDGTVDSVSGGKVAASEVTEAPAIEFVASDDGEMQATDVATAAATGAPSDPVAHIDLTVDKSIIPIPQRRSLPKIDYTPQLAKRAVAMEDRILEMTEVRPPPLAFALSSRRLTSADIQRSLSPPTLRKLFGSKYRSDLSFDKNMAETTSLSSSSARVDLETETSRRRHACLVQINAARAARDKHDSDNPTLKRGLEEAPEQWRPAIDKEFGDLQKNKVGTRVNIEDVPKEKQILNMMVILKVKRDAAGAYLKHKARAVVLGNQERRSVEEETFAPTASENSVMLLFSLAAALGLSVRGFDVTAAFTYAELSDPVYVRLPPQFNEDGRPVIWRLNKSLYGLRRAPRHWFDKFSAILIKDGYQQSPYDACVFSKRDGRHFIHLAMHVDDVVSVSNSDAMQRELAEKMQQHFELTESDSLENVLGFHIDYNPDGSMLLSQPLAIQRAIDTVFGDSAEEEVNDAITPMSATFDDTEQDTSPPSDKTSYLQIVGQLIWLCRTRPDIAYAVNRLSTRSSKCTDKDYSAAKRVVRYLKFTRQLGITFKPGTAESDEAVRLVAWADAAYCVHQDSRSHSGYCFALGSDNGKFMAKSGKQGTITLSSCESELSAGVEATKLIIWLRNQLEFLGHTQREPTTLFADNTSMITLASNFSGQSKRMKHSLQKVHFMMEQVHNSVVRLAYLRTEDHTADILTKPLAPLIHWHHVGPLLGESPAITKAKEEVFRVKGRSVCMFADIVQFEEVATTALIEASPISSSADSRILKRPRDQSHSDASPPSKSTHSTPTPRAKTKRGSGYQICFEFKFDGTCSKGNVCPFIHKT